MDDSKLLETAILYGRNALLWRRKFIGLLPEVNKRKLYEVKNCSSIFEFAAKFGGLSKEQVQLALNLEERFEELPVLKGLLTNGEVSINKLARVVSIARPENEEEMVEAVKLSNRGLETYVRDEKFTGLHVQTLSLNDEVKFRLAALQEKGIDVNELILKMLDKREEEIEEAKSLPVEPAKSRHIPMKIQRLLKTEFGTKCSIDSCKKPSEHIHHTQTYAMSHEHDPNCLAPLCREHHQIAHSINLKVREYHV